MRGQDSTSSAVLRYMRCSTAISIGEDYIWSETTCSDDYLRLIQASLSSRAKERAAECPKALD
jgi:hypothetical protein